MAAHLKARKYDGDEDGTRTYISVITGASSGIARALCFSLAAVPPPEGGVRRILAVARRRDELEALADEVEHKLFKVVVEPVVADVTTEQGRLAVCEAVSAALCAKDRGSMLEHVVHGAAVLDKVGAKLFDLAGDDLRRSLTINAEAPALLTAALHQRGLANVTSLSTRLIADIGRAETEQRTRVLLFGSDAAHQPVFGWPTYSVSKAAQYSIFQAMRAEGCLVASFRPGPVDTPMLRKGRAATARQGQAVITTDPSKEPAPAAEVATFVAAMLTQTSDKEYVHEEHEWVYKLDRKEPEVIVAVGTVLRHEALAEAAGAAARQVAQQAEAERQVHIEARERIQAEQLVAAELALLANGLQEEQLVSHKLKMTEAAVVQVAGEATPLATGVRPQSLKTPDGQLAAQLAAVLEERAQFRQQLDELRAGAEARAGYMIGEVLGEIEAAAELQSMIAAREGERDWRAALVDDREDIEKAKAELRTVLNTAGTASGGPVGAASPAEVKLHPDLEFKLKLREAMANTARMREVVFNHAAKKDQLDQPIAACVPKPVPNLPVVDGILAKMDQEDEAEEAKLEFLKFLKGEDGA